MSTRRMLDLPALFARIVVGAAFALNVECAFAFVLSPDRYVGGFELAGVAGEAAVRGLGVAFLMWNATYPLVIWRPRAHKALFAVVLAQQAIGLAGETWLLFALPAGHATLASTLVRFVLFDGAGLVAMTAAYTFVGRSKAEISR